MKALKNSYSDLTLDDSQLPGLKKLEVGGKYRFEIEAEHTETAMREDYSDMELARPMKLGDKPREPKKKPVARFRIVAVEPLGPVKKGKSARY